MMTPEREKASETMDDDNKQTKKTMKWLIAAVVLMALVLVTALASLGVSGHLRGSGSERETDSSKSETIHTEAANDTATNPPQPPLPSHLKTMPNVGFLLSGYDILFGNPLPTSASGVLTSDPGFRLPGTYCFY